MATFDEVKTVADRTYQRIWRDWYQSTPNAQPAHHDFQLSELSAGYSHSKNWLLNPIYEGNLDDRDILDADGWPIWKIQLVHEMLHEYQEKGVHTPSAEGIDLWKEFKDFFPGPGHDKKFFTAVAEKASYFEMTPVELIKQI